MGIMLQVDFFFFSLYLSLTQSLVADVGYVFTIPKRHCFGLL